VFFEAEGMSQPREFQIAGADVFRYAAIAAPARKALPTPSVESRVQPRHHQPYRTLSSACAMTKWKPRAQRRCGVVDVSDKEIGKECIQIPAPLSVGAIQQRLVDTNLRCDANIDGGNRLLPVTHTISPC
jgi:glutamate synthase (NADPH/NADH) large chain